MASGTPSIILEWLKFCIFVIEQSSNDEIIIKAIMDKKPARPSVRIVIKYFLLQLPGQIAFILILLLVRRWLEAPAYLLWGLLGFWVSKDIFLFPFLWRFYDPNQYPDRFRMVGRKGFTLTRLNPDGYVQVQGERWQAGINEEHASIEKDESICVEAINGLKLTVRSCSEN
ncbi:MAG: NfeD family protein [Desulfobacterales bacterium]